MHDPKLDEGRDAFSKIEAAERLGVGIVTLHERLLKTGKLRSVRAGRRVLIAKSEIERFLADRDRNG